MAAVRAAVLKGVRWGGGGGTGAVYHGGWSSTKEVHEERDPRLRAVTTRQVPFLPGAPNALRRGRDL